ncbi:MAG: diaminopimelate dehydrogenase, partial [Euryarchaeota archaeon HGW-Euryarchaeota-1]
MVDKLKIGIVGYGNIGKAVELAVQNNPDMVVEGIITRRPESVSPISGVQVLSIQEAEKRKDCFDVFVLCGGSATDLPKQGPFFARLGNCVDSYDTHANMYQYFDSINKVAKENKNTYVISAGWDPGTFSMERVFQNTFLPGAKPYTFYGLTPRGGLSMGHSDAVRRVEGVANARQYTHANHEAIEGVRSGENLDLIPRDMHWRECFVVAKKGADLNKIEQDIKTMPGYFAPYHTTVTFVSQEELDEIDKKRGMCHDGLVLAVGETSPGKWAVMEYKNQWDSNPEATANIMLAYARAGYLLNKKGKFKLNELD